LAATLWTLLFLWAVPVAAKGYPLIHDQFSAQLAYIDGQTCPFDVEVHLTAMIHDRLFVDAAGDLVRVLETVRHVVIEFTANGKTLTATGTGGIDIRIAPDGSVTASTFGIDILLVVPGHGPIFLDAGRATIVYDPRPRALFKAGPAEYDEAAFCAALT
jgi:hypothetical protein